MQPSHALAARIHDALSRTSLAPRLRRLLRRCSRALANPLWSASLLAVLIAIAWQRGDVPRRVAAAFASDPVTSGISAALLIFIAMVLAFVVTWACVARDRRGSDDYPASLMWSAASEAGGASASAWGGGSRRHLADVPGAPPEPGAVGIFNVGNTCFMGSSLQALSHAPGFAAAFDADASELLPPAGVRVSGSGGDDGSGGAVALAFAGEHRCEKRHAGTPLGACAKVGTTRVRQQ